MSRRADGRWEARVSLGTGPDGRRRRKVLYAATEARAVALLRQARHDADAGALAGERAPTVGSWLTYWLDAIAAPRCRPSTMQLYRMYVRRHLQPHLGRARLDKLTPEHVERAYAAMAAGDPARGVRPLAPASVLQAHRILSRALTVAESRGHVTRNVARLVDAPRQVHREQEHLRSGEARAVLEATRGRREHARWVLALALGLRQGEALGLRWKDVDLDAGILTIRRALQRQAGAGLVFVEPKSATSRRVVPLPRFAVEALRAHRRLQAGERLAAAEWWDEHELIVCQANGRPVDPRSDHRAWRASLVQAGARQVRLHDARHTAATLLLEQGVPARVVMAILGHSSIGLTLGTYSHVTAELAREAADTMDRVLGEPSTGERSSLRSS